ncbi:hypothetical protein GOP47_0004660 [Adiantum capillus-veneris]|uniref:Stress-response A/B barrel domain-containing protein n=1 Tax=Adiantum capillus-veneris TaxID=13818 RepID=A0A9D4V9N9_ADICA|nr:hypothetical protein GOP47_0004660 [Adiantum capillus-veneris]
MASSGVVEHVVLFRRRDGITQAATEAWIEALRALAVLDGVLHLYVGAVASCKPDEGAWSFALYGRYRDKAALQAYAVHPQHLQVVALGNTLFSDVMALDWEAHVNPSPTSISPLLLRVVFLQHCPLDGNITSWFHNQPLSTSGPNFSPARARGFEWGFTCLYRDEDGPHEDDMCLQMLSKNLSAVGGFLVLDIDIEKGA